MSNIPFQVTTVAVVKAALLSLSLIEFPAAASTFNFAPLFEEIEQYETTIETNGDLADVYLPVASPNSSDSFPVALMLQGALVDKADYANFASTVAGYGFVVIVPNHVQSFPELGVEGFLPETSQITDVLAYLKIADSNPTSPLNNLLDTDKLALLGHSQGGAVALSAIGNYCLPFLCRGEFTRPDELVAEAVYGASLRNVFTNEFLPISNDGLPVALIQGSLDGVALPEKARQTYELVQAPPKALIRVEGANHYGITNEDNFRDPIRPALEQEVAITTIARWSGLFLRAHVLNDQEAFDYVYHAGDGLDEKVSVISQTQPVSEPGSLFAIAAFSFAISITFARQRS